MRGFDSLPVYVSRADYGNRINVKITVTGDTWDDILVAANEKFTKLFEGHKYTVVNDWLNVESILGRWKAELEVQVTLTD